MTNSEAADLSTTSGLAYARQLVDMTDSGAYHESDSSSARPMVFVRSIPEKKVKKP